MGFRFTRFFLDWAQAFDSVSHAALETSLNRIGLQPHYVKCVMAIYANATFRVREGATLSSSYSFKRGIRQGCPFSPYLFIIVLSVLFEDLYSSYRSLFQVLPFVLSFDKPITHIEYADDTLLVARTAQALNRLLHLLQYLALSRGLQLNPEKCQLLAINPLGPISLIDEPHFPCRCPSCQRIIGEIPPPTTELEPAEAAKYLASYLTTNSSAGRDVNHRYSQAGRCLKSLDAFYRHSQISYKRKVLVHAQITLAILLFGSESQTYTQTQMQKLNTIHYKALRKIFSVKSSYYHRVLSPDNADCSNEYLLKLAYEHMPQLQPPSQSIQSSRLAYLGHLLRHESQLENYFCFNTACDVRSTNMCSEPPDARRKPASATWAQYLKGLGPREHEPVTMLPGQAKGPADFGFELRNSFAAVGNPVGFLQVGSGAAKRSRGPAAADYQWVVPEKGRMAPRRQPRPLQRQTRMW